MPEDSITAQDLRQQLQWFAEQGVDQLVLGCTHYPFFKTFIQQYIVEQQLSMQVVDSGQAIAERVKQLLVSHQLLAPSISVLDNEPLSNAISVYPIDGHTQWPLVFYASKYDDNLGQLIQRLLGTRTLVLSPLIACYEP